LKRPVLFLDDSGVLNEHAPRPLQWERLLAEFFPPRLGGTGAAWAKANRVIMDWLSQPGIWEALVDGSPDYRAFEREYDRLWLGGMCEQVGIVVPSEEECSRIGHEAEAYVTRRIRSPLPGAVEAVRQLHALGYTLHTASGHNSVCLDGYLEAMGVRECFDRLYGPDLANAHKSGPEFYERALADAGVPPSDALVVDDSVSAASWAVEAGAHAVLVGEGHGVEVSHDPRIERLGSLAELPRLLEKY
jgi:HAD superfamily hydrolase (TIGR01509 family)